MTYGLELTTRGTGNDPVLSIMVSMHGKYPTLAAKHLANVYARKYGYVKPRAITGGFWMIDKVEGGLTVAQVAIRQVAQ